MKILQIGYHHSSQSIYDYGMFASDNVNNDEFNLMGLLAPIETDDPSVNINNFDYGGDVTLPTEFLLEGDAIMGDHAYARVLNHIDKVDIPYEIITPLSIRKSSKQLSYNQRQNVRYF